MAVLGQIQGYLACVGMQSWQGLQACAFWPHTPVGMQRYATLSYRRFAVCLLSNALEVQCTAHQPDESMRLWPRQGLLSSRIG